MARINLLPWREELRQEKKKEFLTQMTAIAIFGVVVCYGWVQTVNNAIEGQAARNNLLKSEITILKKQVEEIQALKKERRELLDRMRVIQGLEGTRAIIVHYFDEFAGAVPDGVYITSLKKDGNIISIDGVSESNNRISTFMRQLDDSEWFSGPNLRSVEAARELGEQSVTFELDINTVLPQEEGEDNG